jgi:alpha-glucosidase (family GH31 glycosyl hydrolase)
VVKRLGAGAAAFAMPGLPSWVLRAGESGAEPFMVAGQPAELQVTWVSQVTVRLTVRAVRAANEAIPFTGALVQDEFRQPAGSLKVRVTTDHSSEPTIVVESANGEPIQRLVLDAGAPGMKFTMPNGPLLGLGEGGPQYDRKGSIDPMRNGQSSYRLATHGTRAPVQWLLGTDGWAMFIHQPYGAFDFTGSQGRFSPTAIPAPGANLVTMPNPVAATEGLPLDVFVVASKDPAVIMREYARITGLPELPARWTLGYQQSHRTLSGPESVMEVARLLREKRLPCDLLIYLGTEFTPSGWNTRNGETTWHAGNFPDPKGMIDKLHADHFRVALHIVIEGRRLVGNVSDSCTGPPQPSGRTPDNRWPAERQVACYWPTHKELFDVGVDAWWPDQGDGYDGPSRFNRHRMYWEGMQQFRPNDRPYALHRNASAGIQRYAGYIWSGDVQSRWDTLAAHVPVGINTGLSGLPLWGTDIGGFYGTTDFTGELFVRWFQFAAFCPLFRSHGRNWHLHTPWGWDGGDGGPNETANFRADPAELNNKSVEPICRQYLELRSRLMPYSYTALKDTTESGLPMMRALWLHYPNDARAVERGDEYLWGRDILVAPVVEKGATARKLYLPAGYWFDFWTEEPVPGEREIHRPVDLATTPLFVRAGAVIPTGPVKQYDGEQVPGNTQLTVYPGADGTSSLYEDDGNTFDYRKGASMRVVMTWREAGRVLSLRLAPGSRMLGPTRRVFDVRMAGSTAIRAVPFDGRPVEVRL